MEQRIFARLKARELTEEELTSVAGGDGACFYCVPNPSGPSGGDEKVYGPD